MLVFFHPNGLLRYHGYGATRQLYFLVSGCARRVDDLESFWQSYINKQFHPFIINLLALI
jgi:hypothetical protein